jgi:hypothetical protein
VLTSHSVRNLLVGAADERTERHPRTAATHEAFQDHRDVSRVPDRVPDRPRQQRSWESKFNAINSEGPVRNRGRDERDLDDRFEGLLRALDRLRQAERDQCASNSGFGPGIHNL